jgi:hypothetical protein
VPTEAALAKQEGRTYEPASVLLERILTERRRRWSESGKKGKYQEPTPPDITNLPKLPEGWCWATVDMLADVKGGVTKGQKRKLGECLREVLYLRVANVQRGYLDLSEVKTIEATEAEIRDLRLEIGDILFNEGGDRDKLGRGWVWAGELPECIHQNHVFRARLRRKNRPEALELLPRPARRRPQLPGLPGAAHLPALPQDGRRARGHAGKEQPIPKGYRWSDLANPQMEGEARDPLPRDARELGKQGGMLGLIFRKSQNKIQDPAKLRRLIVDLIGNESWLVMSADVKGDAYEGLLEKNAQDVKGGAGQYFTPRPVIQAMVECMQPKPGEVIYDPACGTGGFLLAATTTSPANKLDRDQKKHLRYEALRGVELVDGVSRLCAMNLFLHGVGPDDNEREPPIKTEDALRNEPAEHADVVLTNPPFGKKSSVTVVNEEGDTDKETLTYNRPDFWVTDLEQAAQLRAARQVAAQDPRPRRRRRARQRALRGRRRRDRPPQAAARVRRAHAAAPADRHLLRPGRQGQRPVLRAQARRRKPWTKKVWVYDHRTNCTSRSRPSR